MGALPGQTSKNDNYSSSFTRWHYQFCYALRYVTDPISSTSHELF